MRNFVYLDSIGVVGPNVQMAHCIWLDDEEYPYYGGQFVSLPVLKKELKNNNFTAGQKGIVRALERQGFVPTRIQKRVDGSVKKLRLYVHESLQDTPHTELYDILKNMNYPI